MACEHLPSGCASRLLYCELQVHRTTDGPVWLRTTIVLTSNIHFIVKEIRRFARLFSIRWPLQVLRSSSILRLFQRGPFDKYFTSRADAAFSTLGKTRLAS